ncbi:Putative DNA-binding domain-containing protein [Methylomagnum ishizawai]|uniref:DNA-binding domain-containing protein n=1 Tax=Methylomagnum ishizawai TaxID=1760988 RepID=A0A1Y6D3V6_9GAMM|nr:DNA-binding domain-containing protein [Methylomagnum ishizawai]SMF97629.1 Putative DNA-binding domain-containing protein [Methylomagnum ishizawai]
MPTLLEVQRGVSAAVFDGDATTLPWIRENGWAVERRLAVYRNNTFLGLIEALRAVFPVVRRLVGGEFFAALARHGVAWHPPRSGCLLDYGAEFPGDIEAFDPARDLPYLPDVARLEWAWHGAFHAPESTVFGLAELAALPPRCRAGLRLRPRPGAAWLASAWPVLRIFHVNQPGYPGDPGIDLYRETGCRVLVLRDGAEVVLHPLSAGEFACLDSLARDADLERALRAGPGAEPGFDPAASLARLLGLNVFCHYPTPIAEVSP